ncbi:MAG: hypothetical protein IPK82_38085 [Polyangiaceae bacterium]|nr:hypothetical protein [Polyangiaceae bacterium]
MRLKLALAALTWTLGACATTGIPATPPVDANDATAAAPPQKTEQADVPLRIERTGVAAPWFLPDGTNTPLWKFAPESVGVSRAINPILGEPKLMRLENELAVLSTNVGTLLYGRSTVWGVMPKSVHMVGLLSDGRVVLENDAYTPFLASNLEAAVGGKWSTWLGVERVFDAAENAVIALVGGKLSRSTDVGKTWKVLPIKGDVQRALIRPDGVAVVLTTGNPWKVVNLKDKVVPLAGDVNTLIRWRAWIMTPPERGADGSLAKTRVLVRDGSAMEKRSVDRTVNSAELFLFSPNFLGPRSPAYQPAWKKALDDAPLGCADRRRPKLTVPDPDCPSSQIGPVPFPSSGLFGPPKTSTSVLSMGEMGGVLGLEPPAKTPPCHHLLCIAEHVPPPSVAVNSAVQARFFGDGFCTALTGGRCAPDSPVTPVTVGFYDARTNELHTAKTPAQCVPKMLRAAHGLILLECERALYAATNANAWTEETGFTPIAAQTGLWDSSIRLKAASDGTLAACQGIPGKYVGVHIRPALAPGATWRSVALNNAVFCEALPNNAALVGAPGEEGKKLNLWIAAPEGNVPVVVSDEVPGDVEAVQLEDGLVKLVVRRPDFNEVYTLMRSGKWEFDAKKDN